MSVGPGLLTVLGETFVECVIVIVCKKPHAGQFAKELATELERLRHLTTCASLSSVPLVDQFFLSRSLARICEHEASLWHRSREFALSAYT